MEKLLLLIAISLMYISLLFKNIDPIVLCLYLIFCWVIGWVAVIQLTQDEEP